MNQFLSQSPGTFAYNVVTILAWNGEPRYAQIEAVVLADNGATELTVAPTAPGAGRVEIRLPFNPAPTPDQAAAHFLAQFRLVSAACASRNIAHLALAVEHLAGVETLNAEQCAAIAAGLAEMAGAGLPLRTLVLASLDHVGALRRGIMSLATSFVEHPGKVYVATHPPQHPAPIKDRDGRLAFNGPQPAIAGQYGTWSITYTVGRSLGNGADICLAITHPSNWEWPQFADPAASGYTTATVSGKARLLLACQPACGSKGFILHVVVRDGVLTAGDSITITLGDRSAGSPGIRAQSCDQLGQRLKVFGDFEDAAQIPWQHNDFTMGLPTSPVFDVVIGPPALYHVIVPSNAKTGEPFSALVRVCDHVGNLVTGELPPLELAIPGATRIAVVIGAADHGHVRVTLPPLPTPGVYRLSLLSADGWQVALSNPVICRDQWPARRLFWGDLHIHSNLSDGLGEPDEVYRYARDVAGLEIAALTDHDTILGKNDSWEKVKAITKKWHEPERFVTLLGYEYTERKHGGDRNVYYPGNDGPFVNSNFNRPPAELYAALRAAKQPAIVIPHCVVGNPGIWRHSDPEFCPLAEVYSTHGCSESYPNNRPLHAWSKDKNFYGPGTAYTESFAAGLCMGVVGGTDDHGAQPGWGYSWHDYRGGIMGVYQPALMRDATWAALQQRRTIATTGERIILDLKVDGVELGQRGTVTAQPVIEISVHGTAKIDMIELLKNERILHCFHGNGLDEAVRFHDLAGAVSGDWYRCRITQADGEMAWTSPVWVGTVDAGNKF